MARLPPPSSSPLTSGPCTPRHILGNKIAFQEISKNIKKANEVKRQQACRFASKLKPVIQPLRNQGKTYQQIANILNDMGCTTAQGKSFQPIQVSRIMEREVVGIS